MHTELVVWERDGSVHKVRIPQDGLSIGRHAAPHGASYCTRSESVSRLHCLIKWDGAGWLLEDLGSSNGSRINGVAIAGPTPVHSGDVLLIGGSASGITAQLVIDDAAAPDPSFLSRTGPDQDTLVGNWNPIDKIRASYDLVAEPYASHIADELIKRPFERGLYAAFADLVSGLGSGLVGDLGCGPGHVSKQLATLGLETFGVDISQAMIAHARRRFPAGRFRIASMLELPGAAGAWIGAVSQYATLHSDIAIRALAHAEVARMVRAGGFYLHGFYVSGPDQPPGSTYHLDKWFGFEVDLDTYFVSVETGAEELEAAGFEVVATLVREPLHPDELPARRCYMVGRRR